MSTPSKAGAGTAGVAGKAYPPQAFTLEAERVEAFAISVGADPAAGVPPTFAAVYSLGATAPQLFADSEAAVDFDKLLHAEQEFAWERHPEVGETVTSTGRITADASRRGIRMLTFETDTEDDAGKRICRSRALFVIRS